MKKKSKIFKNFVKYSLFLYGNDYVSLLRDFLLLKLHFYRNTYQQISFSILTNNKVTKKKITVLRSSFVHKKAQEHFLFTQHSLKINVLFLARKYKLLKTYWLFFIMKNLLKKSSSSVQRFSYKLTF